MRRRNQRVIWLAGTTLLFSAFSFAAGFGVRGLAGLVTSGRLGPGGAAAAMANNPRLASTAPGAGEPDLRPAELYKDVYNKLHLFYVDPLPTDTQLAEGSVDQMLAELKDPNTRLVSAHEWSAIQDLEKGNLHGLGAVLTVKTYTDPSVPGPKPAPGTQPMPHGAPGPNQERNVTIVSVLPGSVAEKAGLQPGDRITYLDGHWIAPIHLSFRELSSLEDDLGPQDGRPVPADELPQATPGEKEERQQQRRHDEEVRRKWIASTEMSVALDTLQAGKPGEHELTVVRAGEAAPRKIKVTLADGHADLFAARKINPSTGYVRLGAITPATVKEAERAFADFAKGGVSNLVLDLRESPGGSIEQVREIVGAIDPGAMVEVSRERDASRKLADRKVTAPRGAARLHPSAISVLVDKGTAGASEVLAAALRDDLGARLVGDTTFGDGTEQDFIPLPDGAAVSITHAHMLTPKGVDFDGKGLKPDLPGGPGDAGIDAAVRALAPVRSAARGRR